MKQTVTQADFLEAFRQADRTDNFSADALVALFNYFEEIDPDMELDVIAICCEYSESTYEDVADSYKIETTDHCDDSEELNLTVIEYLKENTSVVAELADTVVYAQF